MTLPKLLILPCLLITLLACSTKTITPETHAKVVPLGNVHEVKVQNVTYRRENGFLTAYITLLNSHRHREELLYRFNWVDSYGLPVGSEESWKPKLIQGEQTVTLRGMAKNEAAVDFKIELSSDNANAINN
jgi:uncharacterized protein YcfL